jgi:GNAT superfamily N-acetyltransferase
VVSEVAVVPAWRRRGVGRELLRRLLRATAAPRLAALRGGPEFVAAFPPPATRPFFACVIRVS